MRVMKPLSWRMRVSLQIRAMRRDHRGVSAVEFALIVPLLILMYVGVAEMGNSAHSRAARGDYELDRG